MWKENRQDSEVQRNLIHLSRSDTEQGSYGPRHDDKGLSLELSGSKSQCVEPCHKAYIHHAHWCVHS